MLNSDSLKTVFETVLSVENVVWWKIGGKSLFNKKRYFADTFNAFLHINKLHFEQDRS